MNLASNCPGNSVIQICVDAALDIQTSAPDFQASKVGCMARGLDGDLVAPLVVRLGCRTKQSLFYHLIMKYDLSSHLSISSATPKVVISIGAKISG
jgi:hypothetical protein